MTVYLVQELCCEEYGCRETVAVFSTKQQAENYIADKQKSICSWYGEDEQYTIEEWEVQ